MPASRAFSFIYQQCTKGLDDETKLKIDVLLGDPAAVRELQHGRMVLAAESDWEVG